MPARIAHHLPVGIICFVAFDITYDMAVNSQRYSRDRVPQLPLYDSRRRTVCE
jgi:hypothetical protein